MWKSVENLLTLLAFTRAAVENALAPHSFPTAHGTQIAWRGLRFAICAASCRHVHTLYYYDYRFSNSGAVDA